MSPTLKVRIAAVVDGTAAAAAAVAAYLAEANPDLAAQAAPYVAGVFAALAAVRAVLGMRKAKPALAANDSLRPAMVYGPSGRQERRG